MNAAAAIVSAVHAALSQAPAVAARVAKGDAAALPLNLETGVLIRAAGVSLGSDLPDETALASVALSIELRKRGPNDEDAATALDALFTATHGRLAADPTLGLAGVRLVAEEDFADFETDANGEVFIHSATLRYTAHGGINLSTLELE